MLRLLAVVFLWTGCAADAAAQPAADANAITAIDLPAPLDRVLRDYEAGWRARDAYALAELFTEDGFILRPGHPPVRGRDAIAEAYANSGGPLYLSAYAYATEGDVGYIIGGYRGQAEGPDTGKYTLTLRREADGRWYIASDMDNGNRR
ncbi:MAG: SgcJ/EcaC family oxidoreductase [Bacteroidota bacterium]